MQDTYNIDLVTDILNQIFEASLTVSSRFASIKSANDFIISPAGSEKLDSICMVLIAIGEGLKNVDKITNKKLLAKYPEVDWKGAKGMRDIISHHYFDIDEEEIFWVCKNHIPILSETIARIISDLNESIHLA